MNYKDLIRIYWDINRTLLIINDPQLFVKDEIEDMNTRLNWCCATIDEELRQLESNNG